MCCRALLRPYFCVVGHFSGRNHPASTMASPPGKINNFPKTSTVWNFLACRLIGQHREPFRNLELHLGDRRPSAVQLQAARIRRHHSAAHDHAPPRHGARAHQAAGVRRGGQAVARRPARRRRGGLRDSAHQTFLRICAPAPISWPRSANWKPASPRSWREFWGSR